MQESVSGTCQSLAHRTHGQGDGCVGAQQPWGRWASGKRDQEELSLDSTAKTM